MKWQFTSSKEKIWDLLTKKHVFVVPPYQRTYTRWRKQVEEFREDLVDFPNIYFLWTIVLNNEFLDKDNQKEIIDGQQRLMTVTLAYSVIRIFLKELKDHTLANEIVQDYLKNLKHWEGSIKLIPGQRLRDFFENEIINKDYLKNDLVWDFEEQKNLIKNYKYLYDRVKEYLHPFSNNEDKKEKLKELRTRLDSLECVLIEVDNQQDAYIFFETLNARWLELSVWDVLKNLFFRKIEWKSEKVNDIWTLITNNMTDWDNSVDITQFLRHYWLSKHKYISKKDLFSEIKDKFQTEKEYNDLLDELLIESENYNITYFPKQHDRDNTELEIYKSLRKISSLDFKQPYSLFLSLIRKLPLIKTKILYQAFDWIEKWTFVILTIGKKSPSSIERFFTSYAKKINDADNKESLEKILLEFKESMLKHYPTKEEFIKNFSEIEYSGNNNLIKYVFERLNYWTNKEQVLDHVTIEHILPRDPKERKLTKKDIKDFVNSIWNLVILWDTYNKKASNYTLEKKIPYYKESQLQIVKETISFIENKSLLRNETIINERAKYLAEKAWELWQLS